MSLRQRANLILLVSAILYGFVFIGQFYFTSPYYGLIYWCIQSALIGSVADWFAVTALFRKPLGFPYHTALIPRKKDKLVEGIVRLVEDKLLTITQWQGLVKSFNVTKLLSSFLNSANGRTQLRQGIHRLLQLIWGSKKSEEWPQLLAHQIYSGLKKQTITPYIKNGVQNLLTDPQYESQLTGIAVIAQAEIHKPGFQNWLVKVIEDIIARKKEGMGLSFLFTIGEFFNVINVEDISKSITLELNNILENWKNPESALRKTCLLEWSKFATEFSTENSLGIVLEKTYQKWLLSLNIKQMIESYICPYIEEVLEGDNYNPEVNTLTTKIEETIYQLWQNYGQDEVVQTKLNQTMQAVLGDLLLDAHNLIGVIIKYVLNGFSAEKFNYFIESKVDDDLSWIRINGAFVGSVIGILVWAFLFYLYDPFLRILVI